MVIGKNTVRATGQVTDLTLMLITPALFYLGGLSRPNFNYRIKNFIGTETLLVLDGHLDLN